MSVLKAPFPAIGGKSRAADLVWSRLGDVRNYIEPFCFSAAVLLRRPHEPRIETINDWSCYVANFWRAVQADPEAVAAHADWPVIEADLHARHRWLVLSEQAIASLRRVREDPDWFDAKIAGWWCWGQCCWIGAGWCSNDPAVASPTIESRPARLAQGVNVSGHWMRADVTPKLQRPGLHNAKGVHCKPPALGNNRGIRNQIGEKLPRIGERGEGGDVAEKCDLRLAWVSDWMMRLSDRLRSVRVCCGDWSRVCSSVSVTTKIGTTGVFLDPPYKLTRIDGGKNRDGNLYGSDAAGESADDLVDRVNAWCLEWGGDQQMRVAVCGLEGEHNNLEAAGWDKVAWKGHGGYGNRNGANQNKHMERIWFSPGCLKPHGEAGLFAGEVVG